MVDISDFLEPDDEEPGGGGEAEDFEALTACLQALADAVASTNLAVIAGNQADAQASTARVQASVAALKRFHDAFKLLKGEAEPEGDEG